MKGLARRLLAAFLVMGLVPTLASLVVVYVGSRQVVEALLAENVGKTAQLWAAEVDDFLREQRALLRALAPRLEPDRDSLRAAVRESPYVDALLLIDEGGLLVATSDPSQDWAEAACRTLLGDIDHALSEPGAGHAHQVVVGVPWPSGGLACAKVSFTLHQEMLTDRARSLVGGTAYIVDRAGEVVCHAFEDDEPHVHPGSSVGGLASELARAGEPWSGSFVGEDGRHLGAYAPAGSLPWGVWVEVPTHVAAAAMRPLLLGSLLFGVVIIAGLVAASVWVVQRLVGQTIVELDDAVQARTRELRSETGFRDLLLDAMEHRILVIDRERTIIQANQAAIEAWGPDVVGRQCTDSTTIEVLDTGAPTSTERVAEADGRSTILAVDAFPVPGSDGRPRAVVEIARDVSALKQFQARLVHQEKMAAVGTLSAGLAHEIGNPLASLSSEIEMLEHAWDPDQARASMPVLREQIQRIAKLLRELVDFGRAPRDARELLDVAEVIGVVQRLLEHDPRARGVEVVTDVRGEPPALCASRDRLVQVLLNFGLNAVDAVAGEGTIVFAAAPDEGGGVRLEVRDSGTGFAPGAAERAFEPFYTTKPVGQGTGLGLFVSERVVDQMGGRIELGAAPEGGAAVVVLLPACICEPECSCLG